MGKRENQLQKPGTGHGGTLLADNQSEKTERYRAPALDKGLDILELLSVQAGGMTRAEIVKAMDRSPSEIYRMLERLVARNYVARSLEGDRYALTTKLFVLGNRHPPVRRLITQVQPLMDIFALEARQSCHLVIEDHGIALVVAQAHCPANWEFGVRAGAEIDLLGTGSGQVLLAFQSTPARDLLISRWQGTDKIARLEQMEPQLSSYRKNGHRVGDSQQIRGIVDITVPILSPRGFVIAVLTCPYMERLEEPGQPGIDQALALLKDAANRLSLR